MVFMSGAEGHGGGDRTLCNTRVSTFVSVTPSHIVDEGPQRFNISKCDHWSFLRDLRTIYSHACG